MRRLVSGLGLGLGLAAAALAQDAARALAAVSPEDLADGRRLFDSQCTRCHGRDGSGGAAPSLQRAKLRSSTCCRGIAHVPQSSPGVRASRR